MLAAMTNPSVRIYHNPRCTKSREALALLQQRGFAPDVRLYLEAPPSEAELRELLGKLQVPAPQLLRTKEDAYARSGLSEQSSPDDVLKAIAQAPILLERPLVVVGSRAVIARPPEKLLELL